MAVAIGVWLVMVAIADGASGGNCSGGGSCSGGTMLVMMCHIHLPGFFSLIFIYFASFS
jgi:hypothetical protein